MTKQEKQAVETLTRMETLYKIKCMEIEAREGQIERLKAENAALRKKIENAVERLKAHEQSVCLGLEWKAVVTNDDINEVFGVNK